ncbi:MAG: UDP-N-acetylmuramoyl-tripeptide--D-alanyl-D-alanine ligase [Chthonomonadales bacterium]
MAIEEVARILGARSVRPNAGSCRLVATDTRENIAGALFVALRGERTDGHLFVAEAFERGAAAALVEREVPDAPGPQLVVPDTRRALLALAGAYRRRFTLPVVAVTGSVGKTSTKAMTALVLASLGPVHANPGNFNNEIGVPRTLFGIERHHRAAVVELAMRGAGQIAELAAAVCPTVGIVTNIGMTHIELLGSRDNIAAAKAELVTALPPGGVAILNADDDYAGYLRARASCKVITFGVRTSADFQVADVRFGEDGTPQFRVNGVPVRLRVPGVHHLPNAAAAFAAGAALGVDLQKAAAALEDFRPPAMRMEVRQLPGGVLLLDDAYNAAPDSMKAALNTLSILGKGRRKLAVLGDMKELGAWSREAHEYVGAAAADVHVDLLVAVGAEAAHAAKVVEQRLGVGRCLTYPHTDAAAEAISGLVRSGDAVLVKGSRAMGMERIVAALESARCSAAEP